MARRIIGLLAFFLFVVPLSAPAEDCSSGTLHELDSGRCLPVGSLAFPTPLPASEQPPSLLDLRQQRSPLASPNLANGTNHSANGMPTPGGLGGGILFQTGQLEATQGAELHTTMYVHPEGLRASTDGLDWLFTTSTNRTQGGVEVVGIYHAQDPNGSLGVFDWSCSSDFPCDSPTGSLVQPAWIWTTDFNQLSCDIRWTWDTRGHVVRAMEYVNQTQRTNWKGSPTWENAVYLRNYCHRRWDKVWQHKYDGPQTDCSLNSACAWWGPILETFADGDGDPIPDINELGFAHTVLIHNGIRSHLPPTEATFSGLSAPWSLFFLDPDQGYAGGNYVIKPQ